MPKTNFSKLLSKIEESNISSSNNITLLTEKISQLTDLIKNERYFINEEKRLTRQDRKLLLIYKDSLENIKEERFKIKKELDSILRKEESLLELQQKVEKEKSTYYKKSGIEKIKSGGISNIISGLLLSYIGRNEKTEEEITAENILVRKNELEKTKKEKEDRLKQINLERKTIQENIKGEVISPIKLNPSEEIKPKEPQKNAEIKDEPELVKSILQSVEENNKIQEVDLMYNERDRDNETYKSFPKIYNSNIVSFSDNALKSLKKIIIESTAGLSKTQSNSTPFPMIPPSIPGGGKVSGSKVLGRIAAPILAYNLFDNFNTKNTKNVLPSTKEKKETDITYSEKLKSTIIASTIPEIGSLSPQLIGEYADTKFGDRIFSALFPLYYKLPKSIEDLTATILKQNTIKKQNKLETNDTQKNEVKPIVKVESSITDKILGALGSIIPTSIGNLTPQAIASTNIPTSPIRSKEPVGLENIINKLIATESGKDSGVINAIGAAGLYQFTQGTAKSQIEEMKRKSIRPDITSKFEGATTFDYTQDPILNVISKEGFNEAVKRNLINKEFNITKYIKEKYPQSISTKISSLTPEEQSVIYKNFLSPLIQAKGGEENVTFTDIKSYGFASGKYPEALRTGNMQLPIYDIKTKSGAEAFSVNPFMKKWDTNKDGILTAEELKFGSSLMEPTITSGRRLYSEATNNSITKETNNTATNINAPSNTIVNSYNQSKKENREIPMDVYNPNSKFLDKIFFS